MRGSSVHSDAQKRRRSHRLEEDDLLQTHEAFQQALRDELKRQLARLDPEQRQNEFIVKMVKERVKKNFKYQKFSYKR